MLAVCPGTCGLLEGNHGLCSLSFWTIDGGQFFPLSNRWWQQGGRREGGCSFKESSLPPPQRWELWRRTTGENTALAPPWSETWFAGAKSLFPSAHRGSGGGPSLCSLTMGSAVPGADSFLLHIPCPPSCRLRHLVHGVSLWLKSCAHFLVPLSSDICSVGSVPGWPSFSLKRPADVSLALSHDTCHQLCQEVKVGPTLPREPSLTPLNFLSGHGEGPGDSDMCPLQRSSHLPPSVPVWPLTPESVQREQTS